MEYGSPAASRQDKRRLAGARRLQYCCCLFPCEATMHGTGDSLSRRDWLAVMGAAGAGAVLPPGLSQAAPPGRAEPVPILPLTSTIEVFTPSHGRAFMRLSFAFPEPSVEFEGYRFGFLVFTRENVYGLDAGRMTAARTPSGLEIRATGLVWAGGQQAAPGRVTAQLQKRGDFIEWDVTAELGQPIKAVTSVIRGLPRGQISAAGNEPFDPRDNELLFGYPFSGGDLFGRHDPWGLPTPVLIAQDAGGDCGFVSLVDARLRGKP